jgi:hypothetical protein
MTAMGSFPKCSECTLASGLTELHSPLRNRLWRNGGLTMISRCRAAGLAPTLLTAALLLLAIRPAAALEVRDLVGWWIAIDRLFPNLYVTGRVAPMEELVVIDDQGRVEDRLMMFRGVDAQWCIDRKVQCSDAPPMAWARVVVAGDQLTFTEVAAAENRIDDRPEIDWALRPLTVTSTRSWTLSPGANGQILTLRPNLLDTSRPAADVPVRTLARIDPTRLRRARALLTAHGLSAAPLSASKHWRCLLANATADDPAFEPLREQPRATPKFIDGAMKVASYVIAVNEMWRRRLPNDDRPDARKLATVPLERLLTETFQDIREPTNVFERDALAARYRALRLRITGYTTGEVPGIALTQEELLDFTTATSDAPEAKRLFCLD